MIRMLILSILCLLVTLSAQAQTPVNTFELKASFKVTVEEPTAGEDEEETVPASTEFTLLLKGELYRSALIVKSTSWTCNISGVKKPAQGTGSIEKDLNVKLKPRKSLAHFASDADFAPLLKKIFRAIKKKDKVSRKIKEKSLARGFVPLLCGPPKIELARALFQDPAIALDTEAKSTTRKLMLKGQGDDDRGSFESKDFQQDGANGLALKANYVSGSDRVTTTSFESSISVKMARLDPSNMPGMGR